MMIFRRQDFKNEMETKYAFLFTGNQRQTQLSDYQPQIEYKQGRRIL